MPQGRGRGLVGEGQLLADLSADRVLLLVQGALLQSRDMAAIMDALIGGSETIFFDSASLLKQTGAEVEIPPPAGPMEPAAFTRDDAPLLGHDRAFE
jgi:hypothetical protein